MFLFKLDYKLQGQCQLNGQVCQKYSEIYESAILAAYKDDAECITTFDCDSLYRISQIREY